MKKVLFTLVMFVFCLQLSIAQHVITTNKKSTCTYNGTYDLQGCSVESSNAIFTFNENMFKLVINLNGVETQYTIAGRTYETNYWNYRVTDINGNTYYVWADQQYKEFTFCQGNLENGQTVFRYFNN